MTEKTVKKQNTAQKKKTNYLRSKKIVSLIFMAAAALFILFVDIFLLFSHDREFSETENRVLHTAPALTGSSLTSGKFMTEAEGFVADQIFGRDAWIRLRLKADQLEGKKESNGVYLGKEGYLLEIPKVPDEKHMEQNLAAIREFAGEQDVPVVMTLIPNAACVCPQYLPDGAPAVDQEALIRETAQQLEGALDFADVREVLSGHNTEELYFRSDHHWTSLGARYAFEAIAPYLDIDPSGVSYSVLKLTDSFHGTMASASGEFLAADTIEAYIPNEMPQYVVDYPGGYRERSASMYCPDALESRNQYEVFLGGNYPLITINTTAGTGRRLLLLKDSYANSFLQFLLPWFDMIQIVDSRYYTEDLRSLMEVNGITDVLILYNVNTFVEDRSLGMVLE